jgi:hypothetical protein
MHSQLREPLAHIPPHIPHMVCINEHYRAGHTHLNSEL